MTDFLTNLFLEVLNRSISAGYLVLAVAALRLLLRRSPKGIHVLLWGLVALRLLLPWVPESRLSLIPSAETVSPEIMTAAEPAIHTGIPVVNSAVNPALQSAFTPSPAASANPLQILIPALAVLWLLGVAGMMLYAAVSYGRLRRRVATAVRLRDNLFQSEWVDSPFVLGMIKPKIYLPFSLEKGAMEQVIAHEEAHIRRKDHWWKPLGFLLLSVCWFHPLLWLAYVLLCRDIELACDESVIRALDPAARADYSAALLRCSVPKGPGPVCPLAFGEVGVKRRIRSVLRYQKPAFWGLILAALACAAAAVCFLTNPVEEPKAAYEVSEWFDYREDPAAIEDETAAFPAFPGVTFRYDGMEITATEDGNTETLIFGMPIYSAYFCDLTGDGLPELCTTLCLGSGIIDSRIVVYDRGKDVQYELWDRGVYDYYLFLRGGRLFAEQVDYGSGEPVATGPLRFSQGRLSIGEE